MLLLVVLARGGLAQEGPRFRIDPGMTRGPATAPVTIVEWSDYECPFCKAAQPVLEQLRAEFPEKLRIVFKDFPLRSHERAVPAAMAARCAGDQGWYWAYHELLFVGQPALSRDDLLSYAKRLDLDAPRFTECLNGGRFRDAVLADQREGREAGVRATPTFFINGRKVEGALPIEEFREAVERALAESAQRR